MCVDLAWSPLGKVMVMLLLPAARVWVHGEFMQAQWPELPESPMAGVDRFVDRLLFVECKQWFTHKCLLMFML